MSATPAQVAHRILLSGAFVTSLVIVALVFLAGVSWVHAVALAVLLSLLPTVAVAQVPLVRGLEVPRLEAYASSVGTLLVLALVSAVLAEWPGGPGLAFGALPWVTLTAWTAALAGAGLAVTLGFKWASIGLGLGEDPILRALIPRSPGEKWAFAGLSVCAGVGEEGVDVLERLGSSEEIELQLRPCLQNGVAFRARRGDLQRLVECGDRLVDAAQPA